MKCHPCQNAFPIGGSSEGSATASFCRIGTRETVNATSTRRRTTPTFFMSISWENICQPSPALPAVAYEMPSDPRVLERPGFPRRPGEKGSSRRLLWKGIRKKRRERATKSHRDDQKAPAKGSPTNHSGAPGRFSRSARDLHENKLQTGPTKSRPRRTGPAPNRRP